MGAFVTVFVGHCRFGRSTGLKAWYLWIGIPGIRGGMFEIPSNVDALLGRRIPRPQDKQARGADQAI